MTTTADVDEQAFGDAMSAPEATKEVGKDRRRKEDQRLLTGRTRWTDNLQLTGMLHLAMVRSPYAHARISAIDTTAARVTRIEVAA